MYHCHLVVKMSKYFRFYGKKSLGWLLNSVTIAQNTLGDTHNNVSNKTAFTETGCWIWLMLCTSS